MGFNLSRFGMSSQCRNTERSDMYYILLKRSWLIPLRWCVPRSDKQAANGVGVCMPVLEARTCLFRWSVNPKPSCYGHCNGRQLACFFNVFDELRREHHARREDFEIPEEPKMLQDPKFQVLLGDRRQRPSLPRCYMRCLSGGIRRLAS